MLLGCQAGVLTLQQVFTGSLCEHAIPAQSSDEEIELFDPLGFGEVFDFFLQKRQYPRQGRSVVDLLGSTVLS
jgi:hypothetical protein